MTIQVGISACLLGERVRYDGDHKRSSFCADELSQWVQYVRICPEVSAGMSVPRPTIRLEQHQDRVRAVILSTGADVTDALIAVADRHQPQLAALSGYILCTKSPSCGMERVKLFDPKTNAYERVAQGLFARRLQQLFPALPVEEDIRLEDAVLRANFMLRLFIYAGWQRLEQGLSAAQLREFHACVRPLLTAQPQSLAALDELTEKAAAMTPALRVNYLESLMKALSNPANLPADSSNALVPLNEYFERYLPREQAAELACLIRDFLPVA